ncbi:MAG: hypothetical protein ACJAS1_002416 [Oleiphilaceae bacterium]|jgi:hypothetical protein
MKKSEPSNAKRPIDRLREGAGLFEINTPDDKTPISGMISIGDKRLLIVKGNGIYEMKLADQTDPERTNMNIPTTIQKVLPYGSDDHWIGAVLLTADELLKESILGKEIDREKILTMVIRISQDIAAGLEVLESYSKKEQVALENFNPQIRDNRSVILPSINDASSLCKEFIQKLDHALRELFNIVKLFHDGVGSGGWDSLKTVIEGEPNKVDNFIAFIDGALPLLRLVRNSRNCVEHPHDGNNLEVSDFSISPENNLVPPLITINHSKTPLKATPVSVFFSHTSDEIICIVELMLVFLCSRKVKSVAGLPVQVYEKQEDQRRSKYVKYGYGIPNGDTIVPFG